MASASSRFLDGFGYGSFKYDSRRVLRVRSLKQCDFCSPSQIVEGKGCFLRTRYLSTEINDENRNQKSQNLDCRNLSRYDVETIKGKAKNFHPLKLFFLLLSFETNRVTIRETRVYNLINLVNQCVSYVKI